ncbi:MAG: hypothetical protein ACI4XE_11235 [Acutalibacteraceae bacterium]
MPQTKAQRRIFAFITVFITVHAYVFYSLYVVNGAAIMSQGNSTSVLKAISNMGGVYMLGKNVPVWAVILTEFVLAFGLECLMGSPCSFRLASKIFDITKTNPVIFETAIICATVGLMCPAMSFLAAFLYYPYYAGFNAVSLIASFLKLVCYNFPFAFFTQLFFIQPLVRTIFKHIVLKFYPKKQISQTQASPAVSD